MLPLRARLQRAVAQHAAQSPLEQCRKAGPYAGLLVPSEPEWVEQAKPPEAALWRLAPSAAPERQSVERASVRPSGRRPEPRRTK